MAIVAFRRAVPNSTVNHSHVWHQNPGHGSIVGREGRRKDSMKVYGRSRTITSGASPLAVSFLAFSSVSVAAFNLPSCGKVVATRFLSISAYQGEPSDGKLGVETLNLPLRAKLPKSEGGWRFVEVDTFQREEEVDAGRTLMNDVIVEGKAWPFESIFETDESFRGYFLSHASFIVRSMDKEDESLNSASVLGCFYIKPNFPGRCSHICNGGFIVNARVRGSRVGTLMAATFLRFARDLGYKAAYFNLVFESNQASIKIWERLGFERVAVIPKAARLVGMPIDPASGMGKLDTAFGYYYDLEKLPQDFDPLSETGFDI